MSAQENVDLDYFCVGDTCTSNADCACSSGVKYGGTSGTNNFCNVYLAAGTTFYWRTDTSSNTYTGYELRLSPT